MLIDGSCSQWISLPYKDTNSNMVGFDTKTVECVAGVQTGGGGGGGGGVEGVRVGRGNEKHDRGGKEA